MEVISGLGTRQDVVDRVEREPMTKAEIEAALRLAFIQCAAIDFPLTGPQKQILLQAVLAAIPEEANTQREVTVAADSCNTNPLDELIPEQRETLLQFIQVHDRPELSWKAKLLNDWLNERDSGSVQFIRLEYGVPWLDRVQPEHIAKYLVSECEETDHLQVGDRIEICNALWEWVQDDGPCVREWFTCTVLRLQEQRQGDSLQTDCVVRLENGTDYEIQGMYEWNRYQWRSSSL